MLISHIYIEDGTYGGDEYVDEDVGKDVGEDVGKDSGEDSGAGQQLKL